MPPPAHTGRPRLHSWRTLLNAIFYQLRTGVPGVSCPRNGRPGKRCFRYFRRFRVNGTWERVHATLRERLRVQLGRDPQPSAGSIDSQRVLCHRCRRRARLRRWQAGEGAQTPPARRLVLKATVHTADIMDRDGVKLLLTDTIKTMFPRLRHVWLDAGYNGHDKGKDWIERTVGWTAQIVAHRCRPAKVWIFDDLPDDQIDWSKYLPPPGFRVLPRRRVVERTFA